MPKIAHPHITTDPAVCGGTPCLAGTRIPLRVIVTYVLRHGVSPEELLTYYPQVSLAAIYDTLSYYFRVFSFPSG